MNKPFEPDNRFVDKLEWQLSSEFRRSNRMRPSPAKIAIPRSVLAIALIVGTLTTGVTVVKATEYVKDSWRKKIEIARLETDMQIRKARLESTKEIAAQTETRFADGLVDENEHRMMQYAVDRSELALNKSQISLDEVNATGDAPNDTLYAPVVGSRDFVSERLQIEIAETKLDFDLSRSLFEHTQQQVLTGILREVELHNIQAAMSSGEVGIEKIQKRLELRRRFMEGELTALEVEIAGRLSAAQRNLHLAKLRMDSLQEHLSRQKELVSQGLVSSLELTQLESGLKAAQAELRLAALEIEILEKVK